MIGSCRSVVMADLTASRNGSKPDIRELMNIFMTSATVAMSLHGASGAVRRPDG
jgi:hypothetical protein